MKGLEERTAATAEGSKPFSVSKILCRARVGNEGEATLGLFRHMAPLTVNAIVRALPLESRATVQPKTMVCLFTSVRVGVEKSRMKFARGDLAFLPSGALICIFAREIQSDKPLNPLGRVEEGGDIFDKVRSGDVIRLTLVP